MRDEVPLLSDQEGRTHSLKERCRAHGSLTEAKKRVWASSMGRRGEVRSRHSCQNVVTRTRGRNLDAEAWYRSKEYAPLKQLRQGELSRSGDVMLVPGFDPTLLD